MWKSFQKSRTVWNIQEPDKENAESYGEQLSLSLQQSK